MYHWKKSQWMIAARGSCRHAAVPQVLELLLSLMEHLNALQVFLLQLLQLCVCGKGGIKYSKQHSYRTNIQYSEDIVVDSCFNVLIYYIWHEVPLL